MSHSHDFNIAFPLKRPAEYELSIGSKGCYGIQNMHSFLACSDFCHLLINFVNSRVLERIL